MQRMKVPEVGSQPPATILLVDDDAAIRSFARSLLSREGYRVIEAADAAEALQILRFRVHEIHLLVTDVSMPGMSGPELVEEAVAWNPQLPVLYISGSPDHPALGPIRHRKGFALVSKPFTPKTLCAAVRNVLNSGARGRREQA